MFQNRFVNLSLILFLSFVKGFSQENYNNCANAFELCPNTSFSFNNIDANKTFCPGCEDDFALCFSSDNTIWLKFESNAVGGDVQVDFSNLVFENNPNQGNQLQASIVRALVPCDASTYTSIGNCVLDAASNFSLTATGLLPNLTYYIVIDGATNGGATLAAEATFDVFMSGIGVNRLPAVLDIGPSTDSLCKGDKLIVTALLQNCTDTTTFRWYLDGVLFAITNEAFIETANVQNGQIMRVETSCFVNCVQQMSASSAPFVVEDIFVNAGLDQTINSGEIVTLNGQTTVDSFYWLPPYSLTDFTTINPTAFPSETTTYYLTAVGEKCTASDGVTITVKSDLEITNTFTPTGDGNNDTWYIPGLVSYPDCYVQIFDRWGQSVYQSTGYTLEKSWDGTKKGRKMEAGVYFYSIELRDGSDKVLKGYLNLIR